MSLGLRVNVSVGVGGSVDLALLLAGAIVLLVGEKNGEAVRKMDILKSHHNWMD